MGKLLCRASADSNNPPPFSPLLRFPSQAGGQAPSATYTTGYGARGRLQAGLASLWQICHPSSITQSPLTRGKKKKKEEGSTRNVREGSMAKWGCHVVDSKPRSAVSLFLFPFSSACHRHLVPNSARYCGLDLGAWYAWHAWPQSFRVVAARRVKLGGM